MSRFFCRSGVVADTLAMQARPALAVIGGIALFMKSRALTNSV